MESTDAGSGLRGFGRRGLRWIDKSAGVPAGTSEPAFPRERPNRCPDSNLYLAKSRLVFEGHWDRCPGVAMREGTYVTHLYVVMPGSRGSPWIIVSTVKRPSELTLQPRVRANH